jgi:PAS domain S-box-containing protein
MNVDLHDLMVHESPSALVAVDTAGRVQGWNPAASELFGYTEALALQQPLQGLIVPDGQPQLSEALANASAGQVLREERLCRRQDGSLLHVLCTLRAASTPGGPGRLHFAFTDVTPMRLARDQQQVSARYRGLLELAPDAIVIVNDIGRIVLFNARARAMFGHAEADVLGEPIERLMPARLRGHHVGHRNTFLAAPRMRGMGAGLELAGMRSDGTEFPVEISLSPIDSDIGRLVMSAIRDTTERKRIERTLQDKNLELERANRAKDTFLASMSHELRTPLNAILGFTGLLLMQLPGPLTEAQQRQLELVQRSGKHLLSLINDLLDLAKIEAGKIDLQVEPVDCRAVLEEIALTLRPAATAKGLLLTLELPSAPLLALADRRALHQVVLNLAGNAVKFTAQGQVTLRLQPHPGRVAIAVQDTGVGIDEADQSRLFQAFSQVGTTRSTAGEGTGLGLHLSRRLADLMQGHIELSSRLGAGSCFTLFLPAASG